MGEPAVNAIVNELDKNSDMDADEFKGLVDNAPLNIMYCDRSFNIVYVNKQSIETLKKIEQYLPVPVGKVLGANIDIFHKNPSHQRNLLGNDKNLPHQANITVGPETLELLVNAVYKNGKYVGAMVNWDIITEKLAKETDLARTKAMMENSPTNVIYCDLDFNITYMNATSFETLKKVEQYLPVSIDKVVGSNIDIFHKNPSHQRRMLQDDRNLPHRAIIGVGPEKLDLLVSPIYDHKNKYIGAMVTWDLVTEKLKNEEELIRIQQMIENAPINIMMAGIDFNILYLNPKSKKTLTEIQHLLPIPVDKIVGSSIDVFHKNPSHQRKLLKDDSNLPHQANIKLGEETLDLLATAMYNKNREYIGVMVTWSIISDKVKLVENLSEASAQLASAAEELRATASQMSDNSDRTTSQASSAASAAEEVSKGVESVAANTEEMNASIKEISRSVNEASKQTGQTKKQADSTNKTIEQLGTSSQEIGNVIKVISSIAQQTNLLALNATIEAARAGDAGKGFAVVANEVKELAKQTANATEEITQKIGAIQPDTSGAVEAIRIISDSIDNLNGIASSIAASVEEQMSTTNEVARVVQESNQGVRNITENVKDVSDAAKSTSEGSVQLVEAAKGLLNLSEKMQALVKGIKI